MFFTSRMEMITDDVPVSGGMTFPEHETPRHIIISIVINISVIMGLRINTSLYKFIAAEGLSCETMGA